MRAPAIRSNFFFFLSIEDSNDFKQDRIRMHFNLPLRPLQIAIVFLTGSSVQAEKPKEI